MFKNLNQLKNNIEVGQKVIIDNLLLDRKSNRVVVATQSNGIYTGEEISRVEYKKKLRNPFWKNNVIELDGKYFTKIFLEYQKAKDMKFIGDTVCLLAHLKPFSHGGGTFVAPDEEKFNIGDTWLKLKFV